MPPPSARPPAPPRLTHFLCVPLARASSRPALRAALGAFRADVTGPPELGGLGVPPGAVRPAGTLHLTLGVMSLAGPGDVERAAALLRSLEPGAMLARAVAAAGGQPGGRPGLPITLRGLRSTQRRAEEATVLYAPPADASGALQAFCEEVRAAFGRAGLLRDAARGLLLHATVVNTVYVRGGRRGGGGGRGRLVVPHAREMMDRYEDYVWLEGFPLESLAICRMGARPAVVDGEEDEAYEVESEVVF